MPFGDRDMAVVTVLAQEPGIGKGSVDFRNAKRPEIPESVKPSTQANFYKICDGFRHGAQLVDTVKSSCWHHSTKTADRAS